jgi:hypothetical protein
MLKMENTQIDLKQYVDKVLELYCNTPGTIGRIRSDDRLLARNLYHRGVTLRIIEQSMILAAARRSFRAPDAPPLSPIRSLHYFIPVIEEVSVNPPSNEYIKYLKIKLAKIQPAGVAAAASKPP